MKTPLTLKPVRWVDNKAGGKTALIGPIKIGNYFYNSIDPKNGIYRVINLLPNQPNTVTKVNTTIDAEKRITDSLDSFMNDIAE